MQAPGALLTLCANRASLSRLTHRHARILVDCLHKPFPSDVQAAVQAACLQLLARWCRTAASTAGVDPEFQSLLRLATDAALALAGKPEQSADLETATCLFLSCSAVASEEQRWTCGLRICQSMLQHCHHLVANNLLIEMLGSVGRLAAVEKDPDMVLWLAALMLQIWQAAVEAHNYASRHQNSAIFASANQHMLNQMAALHPACLNIGRSLGSHRHPAAADRLLISLITLLHAPQSTEASRELKAAGVLAAAGFLEGVGYGKALQLAALIEKACEDSIEVPASHGENGWVLQQATALAFCLSHQPRGRPGIGVAATRCLLRALLATTFTLEPLANAAKTGASAADASRALALQQSSVNARFSSAYAGLVARAYDTADAALRAEIREAVAGAGRRLSRCYADYVLLTPGEWLEAVDGAAVGQALGRAFNVSVALLSTFWQAARAEERPALGAAVLDQLARLQFCRQRVQGYAVLLQMVMPAVAAAQEACKQLVELGPCYAELLALHPGVSGQPRWQADSVLAAEMQFRLQTLAPCAAKLPQEVLQDNVMPLVYLYLGHPHRSVATAAHTLFCALLQAADEKEPLAPAYLKRALEHYPDQTPLPALTAGLDALARNLPGGSPMTLLCLQRVGQRALELGSGQTPSAAFLGLLHLLAYLLLVSDFQVLDQSLAIAGGVVCAIPAPLQPEAVKAIRAVLGGSDDYVRKVRLVRWFQDLAALPARP